MKDEFSIDCKKIINNARHISDRFHHDYITTTHILMGMLVYRICDAVEILEELEVDLEDLYTNLEKSLKPALETNSEGSPIPFTPGTKRMIEHATKEKRRMGMNFIEPSHLLLGILKDEESEAFHYLKCFKITYAQILEKLKTEKYQKREENSKEEAPVSQDGKKRHPENKGKSNTPTLDHFGKDLTEMASQGKLDNIIGRDREIERMIHILSRRTKANPIILGASGTGKSALADGLALRIVNDKVPQRLKNKRIVTLELGAMVAGTRFRGEFEKRLQSVMDEVKKVGNVILFIDEIHTMVGAGSAEGSLDASNIMKPALSRGDIQCIGATTTDEYRKHFESDNALNRRFQKIMLTEPSPEDTEKILMGIKKYYEGFHHVVYPIESIKKIVELSGKYMPDKFFPDKAIDIMDEVGAKISLTMAKSKEFSELEEKIQKYTMRKNECMENKEYDLVNTLSEELKGFKEKMEVLKTKEFRTISEDDVRNIIGSVTGIPAERINSGSDDSKRYLKMADHLKEIVIHQEEAVDKISSVIKRSKSGIRDPKRPNVFFFVGPSGVGKTFISKKLAEFLFGDENKFIYLDCSELAQQHDISKLIGSPAGYVGYDDAGKFEKVRQNPYSVILLDECEKAHPDIWNIFLRIFEEGQIEDSKGRLINFRNCVIIMTSNIGTKYFTHKQKIGFSDGDKKASFEDTKKLVKSEVQKHFKPEFLNRIDDIIIFNSLGEEELGLIVKNEIKLLQIRLKDMKISLDIKPAAIKFVVEKANEESKGTMGARPLKRAISTLIENKLSDILLDQGDNINKIIIGLKNNELVFDCKKNKKVVKE